MKNRRRFFLVSIIGVAAFTLSACGFGKSDKPLESAFSKDAMITMVFDYTNDGQKLNFERIFEQFPTTGFVKMYVNLFQQKIKDTNISLDDDLAPIFKGKWEIGFSVIASKDSVNSVPNLVVAGKFAEIDKVKALLNKLVNNAQGFWQNVKYEKKDGVEYWTGSLSNVYLAIDGDLLIITKTDDYRKAAIERVENNDGLNKNDKFKQYLVKYPDRLMYMYVNKGSDIAAKSIIADAFGQRYKDKLSARSNSFMNFVATDDGFKTFFDSDIDSNSVGFKYSVSVPDYKLALINKVNSKGLFYYSESSSLMNGFFGDLVGAAENAEVNSKQAPDNSVKNSSLQTDVLGALGSVVTDTSPVAKITSFADKIRFILDAPNAIAIYDKGNILPAISFYFQLKAEDADKAKQFLADFDGYVDQVITEIGKVVNPVEGQGGFIKKDVVAISGGALHKVYVDWKAAPQNLINDWSAKSGIDVTSVKNEFYYGLMGDNVFAIAWYPNFPEEYGKDVIAQNADYQEAFGRLDGSYGMSVLYLNTKSLISFLDRFLQLAVNVESTSNVGKDLTIGYVKLLEKFIGTVKYGIASSKYKNGSISSMEVVKIEKVQDDAVPAK